MPAAAGGRRDGRCGWGSRDEFNSRQQCGRVSAGSFGHGPDDPRIAALFLSFAQTTSGPPDDRVPPVQPDDNKFEPANPVVAAASDAPIHGAGATSAQPRPSLVQSSDGNNSRGLRPMAQSMGGTRPGNKQAGGHELNPKRAASSFACDCHSGDTGATCVSRR